MVLLLYGWEGSVELSYMCMIVVCMFEEGYDVVWLNFCDYGNIYYFNFGIFYFNCIDEVV